MFAFICVERGDKSGLDIALQGVDINITNIVGQTLLHSASGKHGSAEIAEDLVRRGIDVNIRDHEGATALLFAIEWKRKDVAEIILDAGGHFDIADEHGNQPLWYAVGNPHPDNKLIELLIERGADPRHLNRYGKCPMDIARQVDSEVLTRILNSSGA